MNSGVVEKDIFILGAGGFAKEVYLLIQEVNSLGSKESYHFCGFVDQKVKEAVKIGNQMFPSVVEEVFLNDVRMGRKVSLAIGIGTPLISSNILKKYLEFKNVEFPNLIHPNFVGHKESIQMSYGNIITAGCIFTVNIQIGSFNIFNLATTIGHDSQIGSYNIFNPGCNVSGGVNIGDCNLFGTNATLLQGLKIESNSIIGAGSVVTKDLAGGYVYVGAPAKPMRENFCDV